jgi:energy-coupling factor transporter transmembrane protein EcfT
MCLLIICIFKSWESLAYEHIEKILENKQRYAWVAYIFIPVVLLLRVLYSCIFLYSGVFFQGWKVSFKAVWRVALLADVVWLLPLLIRIVYFSMQSDYSLSDVGSFYPYSVLVFFNAKSLRFVPNLAKTN